MSPKRIVVLGLPASGKSTLSRRLSTELGLALFEADTVFWLPGWKEVGTEEFRARATENLSAENWVAEGHFSRLGDLYCARGTHFIWLDYPFWFILWRLVARTIRRILFRDLVCNGNVETLTNALRPSTSLVVYVFRHRRRLERSFVDGMSASSELPLLRIRRPSSDALRLSLEWLKSDNAPDSTQPTGPVPAHEPPVGKQNTTR